MERRVAAILAADMVGYSRLIELDETNTLARQKKHRLEFIDPVIRKHHGRIIKLTGDGILAEFSSVVEAVQLAVELQREIAIREASQPESRRIQYRVAVHLGDVVFDDGDVYGDGVNIAARLEALAEPGGIVVSGTAHDILKNQVDVKYRSLGEQRLKNIGTPVRVFQVREADTRPLPIRKSQRTAVIAAGFVVSLILVTIGAWFWWPAGDASRESLALATPPDTLSIIVLPLENLSGDPDQDYFADGLTDDLTTDLSQLPELFVISQNTASEYGGRDVDPRVVSKELGVRFVLEGSVRRIAETLRINFQLVDGATGRHMWAERFDGSVSEVLAFQDEVLSDVVAALPLHVEPRRSGRAERGRTESPLAFDAFLQGWSHYKKRTPEDLAKAVAYFQRAVDLDPGYGRAHAALAATYWKAWDQRWFMALGFDWDQRRLARRAAEQSLQHALKAPTGLAHQVAAEMFGQDGKLAKMLTEAREAIRIDPNDADGYLVLAQAEMFDGSSDNALAAIEKAMRLDPHYPAHYLSAKGIALFNLGRFEEAAEFLERALDRNPSLPAAQNYLLATYVKLGRPIDDIKQIVMRQSVTVDALKLRWRYRNEEDWERLADALIEAGIPH